MNRDMHPEADLDLALNGILPAAQRVELNAHLAACGACSVHMVTARGVRQTLAAQPWDEQLDRQVVNKAMAQLFPVRSAKLWYRRGFRLASAVSVLLLAAGVAGAALWRSHRPISLPLPLAQPADKVVEVPAPRSVAEPSLAVEPAAPADEPQLQRTPRAQPTAAALFAQAVALRGEGKVDAAIATHQRLQRLYPGARETRVSFALAGRLLLEKRSPELALAQFDQYLSRPGDIAEEALVGRATALGRLGRTSAEVAAWQEVLARHPGSVWATQAKSRLAALAAKPAADPTPSR